MITNNFLNMLRSVCLHTNSESSTAVSVTFVDNEDNNIGVGISMPSNNDASTYAHYNRRFNAKNDYIVNVYSTPIDNISPETLAPTGTTSNDVVAEMNSVSFSMADGDLTLTYNFDVTNNGESDFTLKSFTLNKESYYFEYDSGYSEWNHYKNTNPMVYSVCNTSEDVVIGAGESFNIIVKEIITANVE